MLRLVSVSTIAVDALRAIRRNSVDSQNFLGNWGRGDPCMRNWTGVGCSDAHLVDGYLHIQELYVPQKQHSPYILVPSHEMESHV